MRAVILAGERPGENPLTAAGGVACKALLPIGDRSMLQRVLDALRRAETVDEIIVCGPAALSHHPGMNDTPLVAAAETPALSVLSALETLSDDEPVLVTTADHALLRAEIVDYFVSAANAAPADVTAGVARLELVRDAYPQRKKTPHRLRGGSWCGCNLFLMHTPAARAAPEYWRRVEANRKRPWRAAGIVGWSFLLRYLLRSMTLESATRHIANRMGINVQTVALPFAEAAVDVDSVADWEVVQRAVELASEA